MSDEVEALAAAQEDARKRVKAISANQWDLQTPCTEWQVRDLVLHMAVGSNMSVTLLAGEEWDRGSVVKAIKNSDDLPGEWEARAAAELIAFSEPGALDRTVKHPMAGEMPSRQFIGLRTGDALLHAWDLSRSIGFDEALDPGVVTLIWAALQPMKPMIGQLGVFGTGPSGNVGDDAPMQERLLDLTGRRP